MSKYREDAAAKINLFLQVTGKRHDNYHLLYSHVVFCSDIADSLVYKPSDRPFTLTITGPFKSGVPDNQDNLVYRAFHLFCDKFNVPFTGNLELTKNLPVGAGIGGGSSDAAAALRLFARIHNINDEKSLIGIAQQLGADVPMCFKQQSAIVTGIGEEITPLNNLPECHLLLVNPNVAVYTPAVFKNLKADFNAVATPIPVPFKNQQDYFTWLKEHKNDLSTPAEKLCQDIKDVKTALKKQKGQKYIGMSGSGATCFALFKDKKSADRAQKKLRKAHPAWWVKSGSIHKHKI